jgi:hypothetical protein
VSQRRAWLAEVLQENGDSTPEDAQYKHITKLHTFQKQIRNAKDVHDSVYIDILIDFLIFRLTLNGSFIMGLVY